MKKITYSNIIKFLVILFLATGIIYLWLSLLHLKINPNMLVKRCPCTFEGVDCEVGSLKRFIENKKYGTPIIKIPESEKVYGKCYREGIFKKAL